MVKHIVKFKTSPRNVVLLEPSQVIAATVEQPPVLMEPPPLQAEEILGKIASGVQQIEARTNQEVLDLAVSLARMMVQKLVGNSADMQDARLRRILEDTVAGPEPAIGVYLNSQNLDSISGHLSKDPTCQNVELFVDDSIRRGECRVEFHDYDLVSNIENQLDEIEAHLSELIDE